jgi:TetR/AcrR family transcriptional regulator
MSQKPGTSTEQAIMIAAEALFLEKGYARTSTTEIARMARCNQALVHYYYRSKENLFGLVFQKKISLFLSFFLQISNENLPFEEKLIKRVEAHFEMLRVNRTLPVMFFNEITTNSELAQKIIQNFNDLPLSVILQIQSELDVEYQAGRIRKTLATDLIFQIFSMNVMAFLTLPLIKLATGFSDNVIEEMLEERKKSNITAILNSLKF